MTISENISIRELMSKLEWDRPYSTQDLEAMGLPATSAARLAESGWLKRLGRGVYKVPNGTLDRDKVMAFLVSKLGGIHVGGKTALAWRGVRHNVAQRERVHLWGTKALRMPDWLPLFFEATYQSTQIFDDELAEGFGLAPLPGGHPKVLVSVPERALLELFSDTGKLQSFEETANLVDGVRNLRLDVLDTLLAHTRRVKVARLAKMFAEDLDLPWQSIARKHSDRLGSSSRWVAVTRDKKTLSLNK
jgi:hypothetical protein